MDKVRQANETLRQENGELRTTINNLTKEIAEIRKLLLSNNEPPQRPMPSTSKTEEIITNSQETALEEPVLKKRAFEANRKQKENERNDNLEAKFGEIHQNRRANHGEHRSCNSNETNSGCLPSREREQNCLHRKDPAADREHPTFAPLFALQPPNQETPYTPTQSWPPAHQQQA